MTETEVNSLFLGNCSNKRRVTGEPKAMHAIRLGSHGDEKKSEELIPLKVWKILTPEARIAMESGEEVKIGLVKYGSTKETKRGGGKMSSYNKKARTKFIRLAQPKGKNSDASFMKSVDEFITGCSGPS